VWFDCLRGDRNNMQKPICSKCVHLYTTWDRNFPYGCRAMGIKSASSPSEVVRGASGQNCLAYTAKQGKVE